MRIETTLKIKPLSINEAYKGRRFKTEDMKKYIDDIFHLLPKDSLLVSKTDKLSLKILFRFSSRGSDLDNCCKVFMDILAEAYRFNDNQIWQIILTKKIVEKGEENIDFVLEKL